MLIRCGSTFKSTVKPTAPFVDEISYLFKPSYIDDDNEFFNLTKEDLKDLDDLATLMLDPNKNFDELRYLFYNDKKFRILNTPLISDSEHIELEINN